VSGGDEVTALVGYGEFLFGWCGEAQFGDVRALEQLEAQSHRHRRLDSGSVHFAVALRRVAVAAREQRAGNQHREQHLCAGREVANVNIAAALCLAQT